MSTEPTTDVTTSGAGPVPSTARRGLVLGGLGLPLLAACGGDDATPADSAATDEPSVASPGGGDVTVATSDVPVGGGIILADDKVVVTQPTEGEFKAFTAVCTHQQCTVTSVQDGTINCPCHGSMFDVTDGSVVGGPAPSPLAEVPFSVEGDDVVVG